MTIVAPQWGQGNGSDTGIVLADIAVIVGIVRCVHRLACDVEVACSATVGEDAEVTDAMHAVGGRRGAGSVG